MQSAADSPVLQRQLLLQLGDRLRRLRKARKLSSAELAQRASISRSTLGAIEAGDPGPSMGNYLRVMSELGIGGDLALLAGDVLSPPPADSAAGRSRQPAPQVSIRVSADATRHQVQDLQSLVLHEEAVRRVRAEPQAIDEARQTLRNWLAKGNSRSTSLWLEWDEILSNQAWAKVLRRSRRAQELRQASPLLSVLSEEDRLRILKDVSSLKRGVELTNEEGTHGTI